MLNQDRKESRKATKVKSLALLLIIIFLVGNIGFYFQERAKWIHKGQPYPEAKEWLVPANMMLVYGTTITKLPFIDERSFTMKPIIALQDYFVSKWQEKLPDNDAEKYLGWYIFRLRTYMVPKSDSVILYNHNTYSHEETRQANEKAWKVVEHMVKYQALDEKFNEMRLTAFLNMAFFYVKNASIYWYLEESNSYKGVMFEDTEKMQRFEKLFDYMQLIEAEYKEKRPNYYKKHLDLFIQNSTLYNLTDYLLRYQLFKIKDEEFVGFCNVGDNAYLREHFTAKKNLQHLYDTESEKGKKSIEFNFKKSIDNEVEKICKNTTKE
jgi:hypothetical protein